MEALFLGMFLGLTITVSIGPGFIALFQTSLVRGINAGVVFATGMLLSDLTLVCLSYFGLSSVFINADSRILGVVAGSILIVMGGVSIFKFPSLTWGSDNQNLQNNFKIILVKGYVLNIANPFSFIFWIGIVGFATKNWGIHSENIFLFLAGVFITAYSTDVLKCYLSGLLRKVLASNAIHWINRIMGIVFIGIGLFIIYKVYWYNN